MTQPQTVKFTVIAPVFCEEESLGELADRVAATFATMGEADSFELLIVDDGSTDGTAAVIGALESERPYVRSVTLRRNCGKSMALMAGFENAAGELIFTMDGDLQDNPEDMPELLKKLEEGFDMVNGWRQRRQDQSVRKLGSRLFNFAVVRTTGLKLHDLNCGFKLYRREVVEALCVYGQYHRYIPLQAHLMGFRVSEAKIGNSARKYGKSKYRSFRYQGLFDLLSILFTYKYGLNPLHFFGVIGLILILPSFGAIAYMLVEHILYWFGLSEGQQLLNRPLLSLSLSVLLIGIIIFLTGFVCDFILHHQIRRNIRQIVGLNVASVTENGQADLQKAQRAVASGKDK
ncbi:MAG: glycosyltransferase family 2 protein [Rhodospirillaceae bacterium]|jgi:glycosyltransferase involved in cell wall biosynthesis|nr:glycosyltransferase family 2 protein [Rhodospirillaceae bacterium]MBT3926446.1 glycosyltransferase family 2 protein [Rhodospirillaceae bacterium]MBT4428185.1 glycosyltransferase family 2 protein [Rhodospirillaceae bacterium]MBT5040302.1 glycosyltransferase family 2 protein [Rhodospirillaceae bacterium]MBT5778727.1 glycosyltransferase family 2 protein [Rhodospirillaceae bacterium]